MEKKTTEKDSLYSGLENMATEELLQHINSLDHGIAPAVKAVIPKLIPLIEHIIKRMSEGGRLVYMGAGTSGRLGILDASECPPTFGVADDRVIGLIAGGDGAIRKAVEFAEDSITLGWEDLQKIGITDKDTVIGIAASGTTPYVVHALQMCQRHGITTACITCNEDSPLAQFSDHPIEVVVGPEFVTGSTRMKAGTAQKLILNMISTSVMVRLGHILNNKMVDMQLANAKLVERGITMLTEKYGIDRKEGEQMLKKYGSVREVMKALGRDNQL